MMTFFSKWVDSHTKDEYVLIVHIIIPINFSQCSSPCVACPGAVSKSPQTLRFANRPGERYPVTPQHECKELGSELYHSQPQTKPTIHHQGGGVHGG